jgi:outer membrane protein W
MKKFIICLSVLFALKAGAQSEERAAFTIGPTVGWTHAFFTPYSNWEFNPEWTAGLSTIYSPWEHWGVGADVRYSTEGSRVKYESTTNDIRLDYLRVPIKGMYFFNDYGDPFRPKITLGPSIGFMMNETNVNGIHANKVDLGLNGSLGFNLRLMPDFWLNIDANYYQGLTEVRNTGTSERNGHMCLQAGLLFGL